MPTRIPTEDLLQALREMAHQMGDPPTATQMREDGEYSVGPYVNRFGTWNNALREAGLATNNDYNSKDTGTDREDLLNEIQRIGNDVGRSPTYDEFDEMAKYSAALFYRYFDSWVEAKKEAGVGEYQSKSNKKKVECVWCGEKLQRQPSQISDQCFCDAECHNKWQRENRGGEDDPRWDRLEVECSNCGRTLKRQRHRVEKYDHQFCDKECQGEWKADNLTGEESPGYKQVEVECAWCEETLSFPPSRLEGVENLFCDIDCRSEWLAENRTGEESWNYNRIEVSCATCGESLLRVPSRIQRNDYHFCSMDCKGEWRSKNYRGEEHPRWKGGYEPYYGSNWLEMRQARRETDDYTCQGCGITEQEHIDIVGRELSVHHIRRKDEFDTPEAANTLDNLVTLCRSCHKQWEGIGLRPSLISE